MQLYGRSFLGAMERLIEGYLGYQGFGMIRAQVYMVPKNRL